MSATAVAATASAPRRRRRTWDVVLAAALLLVAIVVALVLGVAGALLTMASDPCGSGATCSDAGLSAGVLTAMIGPGVVAVVAVASLVERIVRARLVFWVPLAGLVIEVLVWLGGAAIVAASVRS